MHPKIQGSPLVSPLTGRRWDWNLENMNDSEYAEFLRH